MTIQHPSLGFVESVLAALGMGGRTEKFTLNIGTQNEVLGRRRVFSYNLASKSPRVDSQTVHVWKRQKTGMKLHPASEPNPHMIIVGMSGYGKSTLLKHMIMDIRRGGVGVIAFDAHNEHESVVRATGGKVYDAARTGLNIFELDGVSVAQRIYDLTALFKDVYRLGHMQASKLSECIWYTYRKAGARGRDVTDIPKAPSVADLVAELHVFLQNARTAGERGTITQLIGRMSLLGGASTQRDAVSIGELKGSVSSFSLAGLKNPEAQMLYIGELLRRLYTGMKGNRIEGGISMYVVLDEAQFLIDASESGGRFVGRLISEGRKYGVGVIIATHMATQLDRRIVANAGTFITFYPREPSEINYVANLLSGGNADAAFAVRERMSRMRQNEVMMVSGSVRNATVVETQDFRSLPAAEIAPEAAAVETRDAIIEAAKSPVPYNGLAGRGEAAKDTVDTLIEEGKLDRFVDRTIDGGKVWLMKRKRSLSTEHEVCVRKIAEKLAELNVRHYIMDNCNGPDIVAYGEGGKIAVEYETGRKTAESTAKMLNGRQGRYARTIVFVNSDAFKFYKDNFEADGIVVRDIAGLPSMGPGMLQKDCA